MTYEHAPNCRTSKWGYSLDTLRNDPECTCGLYYRILLETEKTMHQAWRKRAEEAELREQDTLARIQELEGQIADYRRPFSHYHVGPKNVCASCRLDLRDKIHVRTNKEIK